MVFRTSFNSADGDFRSGVFFVESPEEVLFFELPVVVVGVALERIPDDGGVEVRSSAGIKDMCFDPQVAVKRLEARHLGLCAGLIAHSLG